MGNDESDDGEASSMTDAIERWRAQPERKSSVERRRERRQQVDAENYAAILYAITNTRPDMDADARATLADAIVATQRERGLIA